MANTYTLRGEQRVQSPDYSAGEDKKKKKTLFDTLSELQQEFRQGGKFTTSEPQMADFTGKSFVDAIRNRKSGLSGGQLGGLAASYAGGPSISDFNPQSRQLAFDLRNAFRASSPTSAEHPISNVQPGGAGGKALTELIEGAAIGSNNIQNMAAALIPKMGIGATNVLRSTTGFIPMELSLNRMTPGAFIQNIPLGAGQSGLVFGRQADLDLAQNILNRKQVQLEMQTGVRKRKIGKPQKGPSLIAQYLAQQEQK